MRCIIPANDFLQVGPAVTHYHYYFLVLLHKKKFVTQSRTGLQIYEGHDDQLNRPGPMA
jgi:hypothetical protein